jgi:N-acetylneuraminic acid mutarotase
MSRLWQTGTILALGLAWVLMGAADSLSQTPPTGAWEKRADVPYRVQEIYPAFHKGQLYLAGGFSPDVETQQISDRVYIYDPVNDSWKEGPPLPEPRHHPYLVSSGERLFSFGGFVGANGGRWSASTDVLMLDESAGRWVKVADLLHPQSETVAGLINTKIYLASGRKPGGERNADWNDQVDIDQVQVFDPETYAVSAGPAAPSARNSAAGAVIDGKLYVVGGRVVGEENKTANEIFDPATQSWETLAPMPNAQGGIAAAALDGKLYVFGGEFFGSGGGGVYEESWVYDPAIDAWAPVTSMPVPRHGLGAVAIGDEIYVVAGAAEAGGSGTTNRLAVFRP